jgi:hypothetical protein
MKRFNFDLFVIGTLTFCSDFCSWDNQDEAVAAER